MTRNLISGQHATRAAALLAAGAAAEYFLDPESGRRRRHLAHDRSLAMLRRRSRETVRRGKYLEGVAEGLAHRAAHTVPVGTPKEQPDDATLAQKVESIAFRKAGVPKGQVSVNADNAVIYLRGHLETDNQIEALVRATQAIEGVNDVQSTLHTRPAMTEGA